MPYYRLYPIDPSGRIGRAIEAHCDTDEDACVVAWMRLGRAPQYEIWTGDRCLGRIFNPKNSNP